MDFEKDFCKIEKKKNIKKKIKSIIFFRIKVGEEYSIIWWTTPIILLFIIFLIVKDKIHKITFQIPEWDEKVADKCCYYLSKYILDKEDENTYYFEIEPPRFYDNQIKKLPHKLRKFAKYFNYDLFKYYMETFQLDGFKKEVIRTGWYPSNFTVTFTKVVE